MNIIRNLIFGVFVGFASLGNSQNYYLFNDSIASGWNVKILNYTEGKNFNRLLLSYQNTIDNSLYPAIGVFENGKIKVTKVVNNATVINFFPVIIKPNNEALIPTTVIQNERYWYDLKEFDTEGKSSNKFNYVAYPYQILAGGIYPLQKGTFLELTTIQKEPDNPGQAAFYNVWFKRFEFDKEKSFVKEIKTDKRIRSPFNEEAITGCMANDTMVYILARRYTTKDFSKYEGVLYAVGYSGNVVWSDKIFWNENYTLSMFKYGNGVILSSGSGNDNMIFPNTTFLTYYNEGGKTDKGAFIEGFVGKCGIQTSENNVLVGGSIYKIDSLSNVVVKKSKTVLLDKNLSILHQDVLDIYEGPDGELTMMQAPGSNEILSITEKKDKTFILTGSAYKPVNTEPFAARMHFGMILNADKTGKIIR